MQVCRAIVSHPYFNNFFTMVILVASVNVGLQSEIAVMDDPKNVFALNILDKCVLYAFTVECSLKIVAEGKRPWKYFNSR